MSTSLSSEIARHCDSQILPYDYHLQADIELVFSGDGWAGGYSLATEKKTFGLHSCLLLQNRGLPVHSLPAKGGPQSCRFYPIRFCDSFAQVRRRSHSANWCFYGELVESLQLFLSFDDPMALEKGETQQTIDRIPGPIWLLFRKPLTADSRAIARSKLTGGRSAGGLDGLTWSTVLISLINPPANFKIVAWLRMGRLLLSSTTARQTKKWPQSARFFHLLNRSSSWAGLSTTNDDLDHDFRESICSLHRFWFPCICCQACSQKRWPYRLLVDSIIFIESETAYETYSD